MGSKPFPFRMGPKGRRRFNEILGVGFLRISEYVFGSVHNPLHGNPQEAASGKVVMAAKGQDVGEEQNQDNLKAAMDAVMQSEPMTRKANTKSKPGKPATKQFLLRMTDEEHEKWRVFSDSLGVSMAEMVREAVRVHMSRSESDLSSCERTDCKIVTYSWGTTVCQTCKKTWRGDGK